MTWDNVESEVEISMKKMNSSRPCHDNCGHNTATAHFHGELCVICVRLDLPWDGGAVRVVDASSN